MFKKQKNKINGYLYVDYCYYLIVGLGLVVD